MCLKAKNVTQITYSKNPTLTTVSNKQYLSFDGSDDSLAGDFAGHVLDDPSGQKCMSTAEKDFILPHRKTSTDAIGAKRPPYLKIMLTPSVWVLALCDFANAFGAYMIIIEGPNFIKNILNKDIVQVCVLLYTMLYHKLKNIFKVYHTAA